MMEIAFQIDQDSDGNFLARAMGAPIVAQAGDVAEVETNIRAAIIGHFPKADARPRVMHLYFMCHGGIASTCTLPV